MYINTFLALKDEPYCSTKTEKINRITTTTAAAATATTTTTTITTTTTTPYAGYFAIL